MGVTLLRNPVLTPYLGPHVFYPDDVKESNLDSFEHETIAELMKQLPDTKVWHLAIAPNIKQVGLFKQYKLESQVQQTFLVELGDSEETLLANMKETARRNARQAEKEVTISDSDENLEALYEFQKHTLTKKGRQLPYMLNDLRRIMDACRANKAAALWTAKEGDKIQAIVWQVWDDDRSYYFMGGQNPKANGYKAMTLLLWHCIREAKKRGNKTFDLEGSMDEGVERFFRNFGGKRALYVVLHKNDSLLWRLKKMVLK
jgi:lipid II:glycine glycyltransferase (peptidoglycan interpeptide bridge formation enzyme)